jgi:hypothetical protein
MNREVAALWTAKLRSGEIEQGTNRLRNDAGGMCCLGVLCEISQLSTWGITGGGKSTYLGRRIYLPDPVKEWAGMVEDNGYIEEIGTSLVGLNDGGASFEEIADIIDKYVDEL